MKNKSLNRLRRNYLPGWQVLSVLMLIGICLLSSCRKEITFEDDFDEDLYYLNGVMGVGESPEFTLGKVASAADTFRLDFSCDGDVHLISTESNVLAPVRTNDGRCAYIDPGMTISPQTVYTVRANINGRVLTSEIETSPIYPYNFSLEDVKYLGESSGLNFINGEIITYSAYLYRFRFEALYSGEGVPVPNVGISLGFGSDTTVIIDSDVIGRETKRPSTFRIIEELITDDKENDRFEFEMEVKIPQNLDSITLIPMVWSLDNHIYQYLLSYEIHERSVSDPFAIPARMESNIEGGVGLFGSYSRSMDTMRVKLPE